MKLTTILTIVFLSLKLSLSQTLLYPQLPTDHINQIVNLNNNNMILINGGCSIYKSYDGGATWTLKSYFPKLSLYEIQFIDEYTGFIRSGPSLEMPDGWLIFTDDGGETWNPHDLSLSGASTFLPLSESVILKATHEGEIKRLDNFFDQWETTYETPVFKYYSECIDTMIIHQGYITQFLKLLSGNILALGVNEEAWNAGLRQDSLTFILRSDDMGVNWDTVYTGLSSLANKISFVNEQTGWMSGRDGIYKSNDGGYSWEKQDIAGLEYSIMDLFILNESHIYALTYGPDPQLITSENSGKTWNFKNYDLGGDENKLLFINTSQGFIYGSDLIKTTDAGNHWHKVDPSIRDHILTIDFIDTQFGFAAGDAGLYRTTDGGHTWQMRLTHEGSPGYITMSSNAIGWLSANTILYKTINAGLSWSPFSPGKNIAYYGCPAFYNKDLGVIEVQETESAGSVKLYYVTEDGGTTWKPVPIENKIDLESMQFTDPEHLYGINPAALWLSNDTAKSWRKIYDSQGAFSGSVSFCFYDSLFGFLSIGYYEAHLTIDGGKSWSTIEKPVSNGASKCAILGPTVYGIYRILEAGDFGGSGNLLLYQFNRNGTFLDVQYLPMYTNNKLHDINVFVENQFPNVWVAGNGFSILFRKYELINDIVMAGHEQSINFALDQNYPNPFNSLTRIRFTLPKREFVTVEVYNIAGQLIDTIVHQSMAAGQHEMEINLNQKPSGVYFYRLSAGEFNSVKKMILLK